MTSGIARNQILVGDVRAMLRSLPDESVHCVVTSPPYWGLRTYGVEGQLGLESTPEEFVANMVDVFSEVKRVLRKDGTCWLNLGDSYAGSWGNYSGQNRGNSSLPTTAWDGREKERPAASYKHPVLKEKDLCGIPWRVAFALQADGWWLRSDIIWSKPNPMPESVTDRPTKAHEYVFLLTKSATYFYDCEAVREPGAGRLDYGNMLYAGRENKGGWLNDEKPAANGRNRRTVWEIATEPFEGAHFATFPTELVKPCILAGTSAHGVCSVVGTPSQKAS